MHFFFPQNIVLSKYYAGKQTYGCGCAWNPHLESEDEYSNLCLYLDLWKVKCFFWTKLEKFSCAKKK